jgi:hypothetical protein
LTLWNPTIHPVTIHHRVPVTREYLIRDPIGNLVSAEVYNQRCITKHFFLSFFVTVSSDSKYNEKYSWSNEFCSESVYIWSIIASAWLQYLLFWSERYLSLFNFEIIDLFVIADTKKIEPNKVITTINEACILQNEVRYEFRMSMLTDYSSFVASKRGIRWSRLFEKYCQFRQEFDSIIYWTGVLLVS